MNKQDCIKKIRISTAKKLLHVYNNIYILIKYADESSLLPKKNIINNINIFFFFFIFIFLFINELTKSIIFFLFALTFFSFEFFFFSVVLF